MFWSPDPIGVEAGSNPRPSSSTRNLSSPPDPEIDTITRQYRAELESLLSVDEAVAEVMTALEANGVLENT